MSDHGDGDDGGDDGDGDFFDGNSKNGQIYLPASHIKLYKKMNFSSMCLLAQSLQLIGQ